jgi:hypothetical protein
LFLSFLSHNCVTEKGFQIRKFSFLPVCKYLALSFFSSLGCRWVDEQLSHVWQDSQGTVRKFSFLPLFQFRIGSGFNWVRESRSRQEAPFRALRPFLGVQANI